MPGRRGQPPQRYVDVKIILRLKMQLPRQHDFLHGALFGWPARCRAPAAPKEAGLIVHGRPYCRLPVVDGAGICGHQLRQLTDHVIGDGIGLTGGRHLHVDGTPDGGFGGQEKETRHDQERIREWFPGGVGRRGGIEGETAERRGRCQWVRRAGIDPRVRDQSPVRQRHLGKPRLTASRQRRGGPNCGHGHALGKRLPEQARRRRLGKDGQRRHAGAFHRQADQKRPSAADGCGAAGLQTPGRRRDASPVNFKPVRNERSGWFHRSDWVRRYAPVMLRCTGR